MTVTPDQRSVLDRIETGPMLAQTLRWASINSGSHNLDGLAMMARELADAFAVLPGSVRLLDAHGGTPLGQNLHLQVRPEAPVQLLLTGHMDTVFAPDHPFQTVSGPDESGPDESGIVNGPGVADMKGGIAVMLAALTAFETWSGAAQLGYEVVINSDEETGSPGSAALIAKAAQGKRGALTYEPSQTPDGAFAADRPGNGNFVLHITGRSAHAGRNPEEGRNAVVAAADIALRLAEARSDDLLINPARIEGGSPGNVVPDKAALHVNIRPRQPEGEQQVRHLLDKVMDQVRQRHDVAICLHGRFTRPPKPITPQLEQLFALVRECGAALGQDLRWQRSGGVCDGNNIAACGVPVIDTMGVRGGAIHSDREFLIVESLAERAQLSALVLMRLAAGA